MTIWIVYHRFENNPVCSMIFGSPETFAKWFESAVSRVTCIEAKEYTGQFAIDEYQPFTRMALEDFYRADERRGLTGVYQDTIYKLRDSAKENNMKPVSETYTPDRKGVLVLLPDGSAIYGERVPVKGEWNAHTACARCMFKPDGEPPRTCGANCLCRADFKSAFWKEIIRSTPQGLEQT